KPGGPNQGHTGQLGSYMLDIGTDSHSENYWNQSWNPARKKKAKDNPQGAVFDETDNGRIQTPTVVNVEAKSEKRDCLKSAIDAYMANGGAITICKPGRYRKFKFGRPHPLAGMTSRRDSDLSKPHWYDPIPSAGEVRDLLRQAQS